jgi:hypothetical protein
MAQTRKGKKGERQKELEDKEYLGETGGGEVGRAGGDLQRDIGTEDTLKRAFERPAGTTRVEKSDEPDKPEPKQGGRKKD